MPVPGRCWPRGPALPHWQASRAQTHGCCPSTPTSSICQQNDSNTSSSCLILLLLLIQATSELQQIALDKSCNHMRVAEVYHALACHAMAAPYTYTACACVHTWMVLCSLRLMSSLSYTRRSASARLVCRLDSWTCRDRQHKQRTYNTASKVTW